MRHTSSYRKGADAPSMLPQLLAGLLVCAALLLPASTPASACGLDWADAGVVWSTGTLGPHTFPLTTFGGVACPVGATVTITVTQPVGTSGSFVLSTPREDCASCGFNNFGSAQDLGLDFDPLTGTPIVTSPILVTATFSPPITNLSFEISDIDFGPGTGARLDQVVVTSDAGDPTLGFKTAAPRTFSISGNTATANCTVSAFPTCNQATDTTAAAPLAGDNQNPDSGTVVASFGALTVTTVTITYNEAGSNADPAGRGIGVLANLTPVELMSFTIE